MNVAMTRGSKFVDVQAAGERAPFDGEQFQAMVRLARGGIRKLLSAQAAAISKGKSK